MSKLAILPKEKNALVTVAIEQHSADLKMVLYKNFAVYQTHKNGLLKLDQANRWQHQHGTDLRFG